MWYCYLSGFAWMRVVVVRTCSIFKLPTVFFDYVFYFPELHIFFISPYAQIVTRIIRIVKQIIFRKSWHGLRLNLIKLFPGVSTVFGRTTARTD